MSLKAVLNLERARTKKKRNQSNIKRLQRLQNPRLEISCYMSTLMSESALAHILPAFCDVERSILFYRQKLTRDLLLWEIIYS